MSPIHKIFEDLTSEQLLRAIEEINESEQTGIIGDLVRGYANQMREITGSHSVLDLTSAQWLIWREGARRWATRFPIGAIHNSNKDERKYTAKLPDYGDLYTVEEWKEALQDGSFISEDGSGYWVKNGLMCRDWNEEVFAATRPLDATHVMWFNK